MNFAEGTDYVSGPGTETSDSIQVNVSRGEGISRASINKQMLKLGVGVNNPMLPSEAFLVIEGAEFPTLLLKEQLAEVEGGKYKKYTEASFKGNLFFDAKNQVDFISVQDAKPIRSYPLGKDDNKTGCVEIWVKPQKNDQGVVPHGTYIGGMDVVDKAKSTTNSLPCILIMNRFTREIVAEYTGRTDNPKDYYEICRKLLLYYNATGMYEQNLPGLFTYFEQDYFSSLLV